MGDISKGVQTRSRDASFCQHCSFVSLHEPKRVDEALDDPDWVISMQEELNNFTIIKFGCWLKDPRITMSLVLNGSTGTKKMKMISR
jgi:hypothetical protein